MVNLVNMGNSGQKRSKNFSIDSGGCYEFEVFVPSHADNAEQNPQVLSYVWSYLQFIHKNTYILVAKDGKEIEIIKFCNSFEVSNEQQEELIFTIRFITNDNLQRR